MRCSISDGLSGGSPSEIEQRIAPFRADFVGETRKLVAGSLFTRDANPVLVQKVAYDMSLEPPAIAVASMRSLLSMDFGGAAGRSRAGVRHQLGSAADGRRAYPQVTAGLHPRRARAQRPLPHAGSAGALQPAAAQRPRRSQRTRRSLSELVRVRDHRAATHLEPA